MSQTYIEINFNALSYATMPVLEFLWGKPFDDAARAWITGLRPSKIRVSTGAVKCDGIPWRVTVMLAQDGTVDEITQEIKVLIPESVENGWDLERRYEFSEPMWERRKKQSGGQGAKEGQG